jgi:hypothetical protein
MKGGKISQEVEAADVDPDSASSEEKFAAAHDHAFHLSEAKLRKWVAWSGVGGTGLLAAYFFGFVIWHTIWGNDVSSSWLIQIIHDHYAALVGTPMSAVTAFCIVSLLKVTSGPIEFEAFAFKFRGASGPIILWVLCFLSVAMAFHVLWPDEVAPFANHKETEKLSARQSAPRSERPDATPAGR